MKMLVTGDAGFISSHYVRRQLSGAYPGFERAHVTVLDKPAYAGNRASPGPVAGRPRLDFAHDNICVRELITSVVPGYDLLVNFAAKTHVDGSIDGDPPLRGMGCTPQVLFPEGLKATVLLYEDHRTWCASLKQAQLGRHAP